MKEKCLYDTNSSIKKQARKDANLNKKIKNIENISFKCGDVANIITPKEIYMQEFLKEFEKKYNNIEEYLKMIGVEDYIIKKIKTNYVE